MKNLNFLKLFFGTMLLIATATFVSCVDDNDDTEAPFLEVSPTSLIFTTDGVPAEGSQASFEISTNRHWTATVKDDKSWVTLSATEGDGSATIQVSIPEGISDEANIDIQISNKVGPLMTETVKITSGNIVPAVVLYKETFGTAAPNTSPYPFVDQYTAWDKSGEGSTTVEYTGSAASLRQSGKLSAGYEGASGGTKLFFGSNANFVIQKISLESDQTKLQLTFGGSYSKNNNNVYDNEFKPEKFHFYLSADGTTWSAPIAYNTKQADEYWIFATSNFTLKKAVSTLYIKFAADEASVFAIDDPTLTTGQGGQEIDLENGSDPVVVTADATNTTETTATVGGSASNIDPSALTEVGVQYTEFSTGTVTDIDWATVSKTKATTTATPWTVNLTNLTKDAQYAFRAYATTASGDIYGEPKTFVAMETTYTQISISDLVKKMTSSSEAVPVDQDYVIEGVICGDPAGKNYSYGTLYLMTEGTKAAGNALSIYNNKIDVTQYSLGDKIRVNLQKDVAGIYKRNGVPQIEGFNATDIEKISGSNVVEPIELTSTDQLASFVCMPVTIKNVTIEAAGTWKEANAPATHTFKVNGSSLTVYINKAATPFDSKPYAAGSNPMTGIVSVYQNVGQLMPRNMDDVKAFNSTEPAITSVNPIAVSFPSKGGTQDIIVNVINQGSNTISATGLNGILDSSVNGTTVTVTAKENTDTNAVTQTLTISLSGANSITVPVSVAGVSSGNEKTLTMTAAQIIEKQSGNLALNNSGYGSQAVADPSTWYKWNDSGIEFAGARLMIGKSPDSIIGMIQIQGNASTATNQGLITNNTSLGKIKSITLTLGDSSTDSYTYSPAFNVYGGAEANALTTVIPSSGDKFNPTFDFSGGNFSHFTIKNNLTGVLYISKIVIVYE